jgi:hypothetical protein
MWRMGLPGEGRFEIEEIASGAHRAPEPHMALWRDILLDTCRGVASLRAAWGDRIGKPLSLLKSYTHRDHGGSHNEFGDNYLAGRKAELSS